MSLVVKCSDGVVVHVDRDIITKFSVGFQKKLAGINSYRVIYYISICNLNV